MNIKQAIGARVREARELRGMSQSEFGEAVERYLGRRWSAPKVSQIESGGRELKGSELFAVAQVTGIAAALFFAPPEATGQIETAGEPVPVDEVVITGTLVAHRVLNELQLAARSMEQAWGAVASAKTRIDRMAKAIEAETPPPLFKYQKEQQP